MRRPALLSEKIEALPPEVEWVFIDEIQKIPELLDEVHRQIEKNKKRFFALTGSSARKLRQGRANLLAGRAFTYYLFPLTTTELGTSFNLKEAMEFGSLPHVFDFSGTDDKKRFLTSYTQTYLREEIQMEALVKNLPSFHHFLPLAAMLNGEVLSWANFASDVGVGAKTIRNYFEIARHNEYLETGYKLSYFATHNTEIDIVVERPGLTTLLIEFKSSPSVKNADLKTLQSVKGLLKNSEAFCICGEKTSRKVGDVVLLPWQEALTALFPET